MSNKNKDKKPEELQEYLSILFLGWNDLSSKKNIRISSWPSWIKN